MLSSIRNAAEESLKAWPDAKAVVLFGSRARGDHSPLSDWDIAFITSGGERIGPVPTGLPIHGLPCEVECLALPEAVVRRKALAIGHVVRGIIRDGKLLAGSWNRPNSSGAVTMRPDEYARLVRNAITFTGNAVARAVEIGETGNCLDDINLCNHFVAESADAAEHLAKAKLGRHGIEYSRTHDLGQLASQARRAGFSDLARDIDSMNGLAGKQHMAAYDGVTVEGCQHAVRRLRAEIILLGEEIRSARSVPSFAETANGLARNATNMARKQVPALRQALSREVKPSRLPLDQDPVAAIVRTRTTIVDALGELPICLAPEKIAANRSTNEPNPHPKPEPGNGGDLTPTIDTDLFGTPTPFD